MFFLDELRDATAFFKDVICEVFCGASIPWEKYVVVRVVAINVAVVINGINICGSDLFVARSFFGFAVFVILLVLRAVQWFEMMMVYCLFFCMYFYAYIVLMYV